MNILILNGHESYRDGDGQFNRTLMDKMTGILSEKHEVRISVLQNGYDVREEQHKYVWADLVIYQTPVYWFSVPGLLKTYMDQVFAYGVFFEGSNTYGQGGLMTGKSYMLSTTWNASEEAFSDPDGFFEGRSVDEVLAHLHRTHRYIAMQSLPSFTCLNVLKEPKMNETVERLEHHLRSTLNV
ncbi:NAD(P)H-dependent oxidoreductase [Paenibacillus filicis]|uniref:NAD(P)H-dependent oxidoreductase n=1 Tax=Paenibacillus filicis TaxID=669464 RepID=A0ABU9DRV2_9BACL